MSEKERHFAPDVDKDFWRSTGMLMDTKELAPCEIVVCPLCATAFDIAADAGRPPKCVSCGLRIGQSDEETNKRTSGEPLEEITDGKLLPHEAADLSDRPNDESAGEEYVLETLDGKIVGHLSGEDLDHPRGEVQPGIPFSSLLPKATEQTNWCRKHPVATIGAGLLLAALLTVAGFSVAANVDNSIALSEAEAGRSALDQARRDAESRLAAQARLTAELHERAQRAEAQRLVAVERAKELDSARLQQAEANRVHQEQLRLQEEEQKRLRAEQLQTTEQLQAAQEQRRQLVAQLQQEEAERRRVAEQLRLEDQERQRLALQLQREAALARRQAQIAIAKQLACDAQLFVEDRPQCALVLACESVGIRQREGAPVDRQTEQVLRDALARTGTTGLAVHGKSIDALTVTPDGRQLITAGHDGNLCVFDLRSDDPSSTAVTLQRHEGPITALRLAPGAERLVSASLDGKVILWDLTSDNIDASAIELTGHRGPILTMEISRNGRWMVTGGGDVKNADGVGPIGPIAVATDAKNRGCEAWLWDLDAKNLADSAWILQGHESPIRAVAFSRTDDTFVTADEEGLVCAWQPIADQTDKPRATPIRHYQVHEGPITSIAALPDGRFASASHDGTVVIWDPIGDASAESMIRLSGHKGWITSVAASPSGRYLASAGFDRTVRLWDLAASDIASTRVTLTGHDDCVLSVQFSGDGKRLISASYDRTVRIWPVDAAELSRDAADLVASDIAAADKTLPGPMVLRGQIGPINTLAISRDGLQVFSGTARTENPAGLTVQIWQLDLDRLVEQAKQTASRYMSETTRLELIRQATRRCEAIVLQ